MMKEKDELYFDGIDITNLIANLNTHINDLRTNCKNNDSTNTINDIIALCNFIGNYSFCWECPLKHICYGKNWNTS